MSSQKRKKIGLALGSGGFRGFAHIGMIKVLDQNNIPIDYISGTSIGSLIAAYYSVHQEVDSLLEKVDNQGKFNIFHFIDRSFIGGLISQKKVSEHLESVLGDYKFSDAKIPLQITATNLINGQLKVFRTGKLNPAIQASCAVPLIFNPIKRPRECLVDGALSEPLPINILRQAGADKVIVFNLYHKNEFFDKRFNLAHTALRAVRILMYNYSQEKIKEADLAISPDISKQVMAAGLKTVFSKELVIEAIKIGEREAQKYLPKIKRLIRS